ncbi:Sigma factor RpoE negative regulatory protein RseB precursor [Methylophaga frappieri]|uniref:Sigma factor RpoE negative regulatory protein RseB n=1 Tax=Methylophaga frappieri (strain ATCC BAA-2434 / DSM 25690 / JAM7) TaxID=754477 RepID=I1YFA9_METFJ|nr:MucB/RseB C-terminal domain-containing protein [Methylophaga frappieri]AFJ01602.1 Sigma factor RpoE negative regulatory protein RseB precursor [Methylophaga frappieri]
MLRTLAFTLFFLMPGLAWSSSDAIDLLERMTRAGKELTYQGVFTYHNDSAIQSVQIYHRNNELGEMERLISLNGAAREVIRSNDMVTCINPEVEQVNVSRRPLGQGFPSDLPRRLRSATPFYEVTLGDIERVAGRQSQVLAITPVDDYRYGYRMWVDIETDLLLKSELLSETKAVLETFSFSSIDTQTPIEDHQFKAQTGGHEMIWYQSEPGTPLDTSSDKLISNWQANWLPEGFSLVAAQNRLRANNGAYVEQRVYSDGLSAVSVFIEKTRSRPAHLLGVSNVGAMNAYGKIIHAHFVTVVGEVPAHTVEKIGTNITFQLSGTAP